MRKQRHLQFGNGFVSNWRRYAEARVVLGEVNIVTVEDVKCRGRMVGRRCVTTLPDRSGSLGATAEAAWAAVPSKFNWWHWLVDNETPTHNHHCNDWCSYPTIDSNRQQPTTKNYQVIHPSVWSGHQRRRRRSLPEKCSVRPRSFYSRPAHCLNLNPPHPPYTPIDTLTHTHTHTHTRTHTLTNTFIQLRFSSAKQQERNNDFGAFI